LRIGDRQCLVELEGVKDGGVPINQTNVPQMQIPVAMAHKSLRHTLVHQALEPHDRVHRPVAKLREIAKVEDIVSRGEFLEILFGHPTHFACTTAVFHDRSVVMKGRDPLGETDHEIVLKSALFSQSIEQRVLIEATHEDDAFILRADRCPEVAERPQ